MFWPYDPIKNEISERTALLLEGSFFLKVDELKEILFKSFSTPPDDKLGELAISGFLLSKQLKMNPATIANTIRDCIEQSKQDWDLIDKATSAGPYVNLSLKASGLARLVVEPVLNGSFWGQKPAEKLPKTMIEYSQPNTHKEVHVGHTRNMCLGECLVHAMKEVGIPVITSTFPGDVGTHVAKCLWFLKHRNTEAAPENNKGEWLGTMYTRASLTLEDEESTPQGEKNKEQLTLILKELEAQQGPYFELWKETRAWSIDLLKETYKWAGIDFDKWFWESDVDSASVQWVKKLYAEGKLVESQGAIGMDLSDQNMGFCLLLKSDGNGLYATKDLELARRKFEEFQIEKSIYVVDVRQALHFKQVFAALERLGYENAKNCYHLAYNYVELPEGPMSSRKGNIVPLRKLIENMEATVKAQHLDRYQELWTAEEIQQTAQIVAKGAIKYGMLKQDPNKKIVFDMTEWLKLDGDSGPFIQYSFARLQSVKRRLADVSISGFDGSVLTHPSERRLVVHIAAYYNALQQAVNTYKPSIVCTYAFELAQKINLFYHECPINSAPTPAMKQARLALADAAGRCLEKALGVMGIPAPQQM